MKNVGGTLVADALADPGSVFTSPGQVVANQQLCTRDKLRILEHWREIEQMKRDEKLQDAEFDGATLREVTDAITELTL
jgi:hypothetical protein